MATAEPCTEKETDKQETNSFDFIPELDCNPAVNGIIEVRVTNIRRLWINNQFHAYNDTCFIVTYRGINSQKVDGIWREKSILVGSVGDDGTMYFKVCVFLNDYNFEFRLKTFNITTSLFMTTSKIYSINIPSFLKDENFKIGQHISFRDMDTFSTTDGEIKEILENDMFKILYLTYDKQKNGLRSLRSSYIETFENVHISRLYHNSINLQYEIDFIDTDSRDKHLFIQSKDNERINIFVALKESLITFCKRESDYIYGNERAIIHWQGMNNFVSKNIFDFLFAAQFKYSVDCIINSYQDNEMNLMNLRQSDIRTKYELIKNGIGNVFSHVFQHENIWYGCDFCRCSIKEWDFIFQCRAKSYVDRHDYCVNCINTIITLNEELSELLNGLLANELISDCIQVIVDYVIGRVILLQYSEDIVMVEDDKNKSCNKRKSNDMLMPKAKRRKLNS